MTSPLDDRLKRLTPEQRAELERRLVDRRSAGAAQQPIPKRMGDGPWQLSYSQELLWVLDQLAPGEIAYNSPDAVRLVGPLDVGALESALTALVERHEILRTSYASRDGQPLQIVGRPAPVVADVVDLRSLEPDERERELQRQFKQEAERPFDLATGPLLRTTLAQLADEEHALLLNVHHIATDGWSKAIVWSELSALYNAFALGQTPTLAQPRAQYADFAVWQRASLDGGTLDSELAYWRGRLRGVPDLLELPTDHPRPAVQSYDGGRVHRLYDAALLDGLRPFSREQGATLFMSLLATFAALLGRYAGQDEVVIGTPTAGRNRVELEEMVGYFMNTLALRIDLSGRPTFRQLVARARETTMNAYANQELPFEKVVTELNPDRDLSRTPLFQAMMVLQNQKRTTLDLAGLEATPFVISRDWSKFDLTLGLGERDEGLNSNWEFATSLFEKPTIEQLALHFGRLLRGALADPDRPVASVPLLHADERRRVLVEWNRTGAAPRSYETLHALVFAQARATPGAVAVECEGETLTYGELEQQAISVAASLRRNGVERGDPVGVCLERSLDLVPAILGVLAAGGVCLPLDPAYPAERLAFMVSDSGARVLVTHAALAGKVPLVEHVLLFGEALVALESDDAASPEITVGARDAAYLVYTSGSTGAPRGVVLHHEGLVNHTCASIRLYGLRSSDRVLQFSPISFDISIEEIFPTLACGATLIMRTLDTPIAGPEFMGWLEEQGVTVLDLPTAFWHAWVAELLDADASAPDCTRLVILGGEKASANVYRAWLGVGGDRIRLVNTYGPTETSVVATAYEPPRDDPPDDLPIGRPIENVRVYVLDGFGEPAPVGVWGELCIGGAGVAIGYHGRPDLTQERFVEDPFSDLPGARMYRTGDLARWLPSGDLQFGGRTDFQVKIRGFRVEPGEVEAALEQHHGVATAVVLALDQPDGERQLAAYVQRADAGRPPVAQELRRFLADRLPSFMIPAHVAVLDALPLTANGKVDRAALSTVEADGTADPDAVEPRTETERQIAGIWTDLLPVSAVGIHDNFFALGGHSLLATRVASRLRDALGIEVTIRMIFEAPTIAELAQTVDGGAAEPDAGTGPTLGRFDRSRYRVEPSEAVPGRAV